MRVSMNVRLSLACAAVWLVGMLPAPAAAQGVPIRLLTCPAGQIAVSVGNGWVCGDLPAGQSSGDRIIFVSSQTYTGHLGGIAGADAKCQGLAAAAGLPGTFKAWLSSPTREPDSGFTPHAGAWRLVDGTLVANDWVDLTTEKQVPTEFFVRTPVLLNEYGVNVSGETRVWTATTVTGTAGTQRCASPSGAWRSSSPAVIGQHGLATSTSFSWTEITTAPCNTSLRIYCVQQ